MLRQRKVLLAVSVVVAGGSFYAALGYAVYLHSDHYRAKKERQLARFLKLPVAIGDVQPQRRGHADFADIRAWLPGRRAEIFHCALAEMHKLRGQGGGFIRSMGPIRPSVGKRMAYLTTGRSGENWTYYSAHHNDSDPPSFLYAAFMERQFYIQPGKTELDIGFDYKFITEDYDVFAEGDFFQVNVDLQWY